MTEARSPGVRTVDDARAAYFAGEITAQEYLSCTLPDPAPQGPDRSLSDQFRRILARLGVRASIE